MTTKYWVEVGRLGHNKQDRHEEAIQIVVNPNGHLLVLGYFDKVMAIYAAGQWTSAKQYEDGNEAPEVQVPAQLTGTFDGGTTTTGGMDGSTTITGSFE